MSTSNELRVFISSTFRDLQEEREHLVKKIFPEIRALCRERGVTFTEVDLRWGLTDEDVVHGRVIRTCLEEIDRCRPYFIGILGDRYGWVPSPTDIYRDADLLTRYPWIEDSVADGASLVAIECEHAALAAPDRASAARFYARRHRRQPGAAPGADPRLVELERRITDSGLPLREFRDAATLGELVFDDLVELLERDFEHVMPRSPLEREHNYHESFGASRRRAYVPRPSLLEALDRHVASDLPQVVISAESGTGKSALVAYWAHRLRRRDPNAFVVEHYVGIGQGGGNRYDIARHLLLEIAGRSGSGPVPEQPEACLELLPEWLGALGEPMTIVLDGVNQLPEGERELSWLPSFIPSGIRMVVTTTGDLHDEFGALRSWPRLTIPPLEMPEREAITVRYLAEFHKSLSTDQVRRIAAAVPTEQPLFLRVLLEELRLHGVYEKLDRQIDRLLAAEDTLELFQLVLERIEEDFGTRRVREVMRLVWASRDGIGESPLAELTMQSRLQLALLLGSLDYHLLKRDDRFTFFHAYLADAVEHRYLADDADLHHTRIELADYFERQPVDDAVAEELPWQLCEAGQWNRLRDVLCNPTMLRLLSMPERKYDLLRYWRELEPHADMVEAYRLSIDSAGDPPADDEQIAHRIRVADLLRDAGHYDDARLVCQAILDDIQKRDGERHPQALRMMNRIGDVCVIIGDYQQAEQVLRRAIELHREHPSEGSAEQIECLLTLAALLYSRKDYRSAREVLERGLDLAASLNDAPPGVILKLEETLGAVCMGMGQFDDAEHHFQRALALSERGSGIRHRETATCMNNLAAVHIQRGEFSEAERWLAGALEIQEHLLGADHPENRSLLTNLGFVYKSLGRHDMAESTYRRVITISQGAFGEDSPVTTSTLQNLSILLCQNGQLDEAEALARRVIAIRERCLGADHVDTVRAYLELAIILRDQQHYDESASIFDRYLPIKQRLMGSTHPSVVKSIQGYAILLRRMGRSAEAEVIEREAGCEGLPESGDQSSGLPENPRR